MISQYNLTLTSKNVADVQDVPLTIADGEDANSVTRKIARTQIIRNTSDSEAAVKLTIMHQRKSPAKAWEDTDSYNMTNLKAGQEVRLILNSDETLRLFRALQHLYSIAESGVPADAYMQEAVPFGSSAHLIIRVPPYNKKYIVFDAEKAQIGSEEAKSAIQKLIETGGKKLFDLLEELQPDWLQSAASARLLKHRRAIVQEFKKELDRMVWTELEWDAFFKANKWIFGHGLDYQFLKEIEGQAYYGGTTMSGSGGQRGDYLMSTEAQNRFTVLVEIKKPNSELVLPKTYRNKVHALGEELTGGVAQLQSNCRTWIVEGSRSPEENVERLNLMNTYTYEPKGILIIGHTKQLDSTNKRATFELFRRNLHNPQIITYDELFARAEFLVTQDTLLNTAPMAQVSTQEWDSDIADIDLDDIPF